MSVGQDIFTSLPQHTWSFLKYIREKGRVSRMTPEHLQKCRYKQFAKIHKRAVELASSTSDDQLRSEGRERADLVRTFEIVLRNDLRIRRSQHLLTEMDLKGLDLRRIRGLDQEQIDKAIGDATTQLPKYLRVPQTWHE